jgi:hypothetical protein
MWTGEAASAPPGPDEKVGRAARALPVLDSRVGRSAGDLPGADARAGDAKKGPPDPPVGAKEALRIAAPVPTRVAAAGDCTLLAATWQLEAPVQLGCKYLQMGACFIFPAVMVPSLLAARDVVLRCRITQNWLNGVYQAGFQK